MCPAATSIEWQKNPYFELVFVYVFVANAFYISTREYYIIRYMKDKIYDILYISTPALESTPALDVSTRYFCTKSYRYYTVCRKKNPNAIKLFSQGPYTSFFKTYNFLWENTSLFLSFCGQRIKRFWSAKMFS